MQGGVSRPEPSGRRPCRIPRVAGVEPETELSFGGLHSCAPLETGSTPPLIDQLVLAHLLSGECREAVPP
jgi:hypothetical protein